jgi:hypothetical protein
MTLDHKKQYALNVKHTVGSWKGTAIKFIRNTDSSNGKIELTQYCLNYCTQVTVSSSCCARHHGRVWELPT